MSELKPCPFCGQHHMSFSYEASMGKKFIGITCDICGSVTFWNVPRLQAHDCSLVINHWNHRPLEEALEARVRELEKELNPLLSVDGILAQAKAAAVQWVSYDGSPETLPEKGKWVMVVYESGGPPRPAEIDLDGIDGNPPFWMVADGNNHTVRVGDRWAYLPQPLEAKNE